MYLISVLFTHHLCLWRPAGKIWEPLHPAVARGPSQTSQESGVFSRGQLDEVLYCSSVTQHTWVTGRLSQPGERKLFNSWRAISTGPVFTNILILRFFLFFEFFLEFCNFLRMILRIRNFTIWNVLKSPQIYPI